MYSTFQYLDIIPSNTYTDFFNEAKKYVVEENSLTLIDDHFIYDFFSYLYIPYNKQMPSSYSEYDLEKGNTIGGSVYERKVQNHLIGLRNNEKLKTNQLKIF